MLHVDHISKSFFDENGVEKTVLDDISFSVKDNEFICILGKSGCGKSTLLSILAGFSSPTKGGCWLGSEEIEGPSQKRGVVFQEHALCPWYTVLDNVAFGPMVNKKKNAKEIAMKYIKMVGMEEYAGYYPASLSGGMKQRVGIARALANNPEVLLMDEPFSALDPFTRERMRKETLNIWENNKTTVVFITHSVPEAVYLADRIILLKDGKVAENQEISMKRDRNMNDPEFMKYVNFFERMLADDQTKHIDKTFITND